MRGTGIQLSNIPMPRVESPMFLVESCHTSSTSYHSNTHFRVVYSHALYSSVSHRATTHYRMELVPARLWYYTRQGTRATLSESSYNY